MVNQLFKKKKCSRSRWPSTEVVTISHVSPIQLIACIAHYLINNYSYSYRYEIRLSRLHSIFFFLHFNHLFFPSIKSVVLSAFKFFFLFFCLFGNNLHIFLYNKCRIDISYIFLVFLYDIKCRCVDQLAYWYEYSWIILRIELNICVSIKNNV